jgi:hypothetical protein
MKIPQMGTRMDRSWSTLTIGGGSRSFTWSVGRPRAGAKRNGSAPLSTLDRHWADHSSQEISFSVSFTFARLLRKGMAAFLPPLAYE